MKSLEILISAAAALLLSYVWYGLIFTKHWTVSNEVKTNPLGKRFLDYAFIYLAMCIIAYFMNNGCLETHINEGDFGHGIFHGALYGLSYAAPVIAIHHIYQKKSIRQLLIDTSFSIVFFAAIGGVLARLTLMVY